MSVLLGFQTVFAAGNNNYSQIIQNYKLSVGDSFGDSLLEAQAQNRLFAEIKGGSLILGLPIGYSVFFNSRAFNPRSKDYFVYTIKLDQICGNKFAVGSGIFNILPVEVCLYLFSNKPKFLTDYLGSIKDSFYHGILYVFEIDQTIKPKDLLLEAGIGDSENNERVNLGKNYTVKWGMKTIAYGLCFAAAGYGLYKAAQTDKGQMVVQSFQEKCGKLFNSFRSWMWHKTEAAPSFTSPVPEPVIMPDIADSFDPGTCNFCR